MPENTEGEIDHKPTPGDNGTCHRDSKHPTGVATTPMMSRKRPVIRWLFVLQV